MLCVLVPDLLLRLEEEWDERRRLPSTLQGKGPSYALGEGPAA